MDVSLFFPIAGLITLFSAYLIWYRVLKGEASHHPRHESLLMTMQSLATLFTLSGIVLLQPISSHDIHFTLITAAATATLFVQAMYLFGLLRHGIQGLGLFLLPVIALLLLIIPILPVDPESHGIETTSILHSSHLLISMLAYAVLTMTAFHAVMHLLLDQALKKKRIHPVIQAMPPLVKLENLMLTLLRWSVWLIALSILTGLLWQWVDFSQFVLFSHKILLALMSFGVLSWLLNNQKKSAWHGRRTSQLILVSYSLMLLAYFGVRLIQAWLD
ncbi:MAG: cytochrome c biogenesis protein CcsA [Mariprofundaceae bacterium]|nr:cytochrome c biogenesis protein CcsA [Mariprofundaceae bacterium]